MTNDDREKRLSKFSDADLRAYLHSQAGAKPQHSSSALAPENDPPLADLLEHAIRGSGLHERARFDEAIPGASGASESNPFHERLIEELTTAQNQMREEPPVEYAEGPFGYAEPPALEEMPAEPPAPYAKSPLDYGEPPVAHLMALEEPAPAPFAFIDQAPAALSDLIPPALFEERAPDAAPRKAGEALEPPAVGFNLRSQAARATLENAAKALVQTSRNHSRRVRMRDWSRRRLALLSVIHRQVFDRSTEQLLFCKTPPLEVYHIEETEGGVEKSFFYQGPIPQKLLDWALSALPEDLKRYAFVDFRAGNGRTLLLAARRNFEYAAGYAFDAEGSETLEMNLAQFPRTYLTCRDVRALRGDRDGVVIPAQPAVLFFPDGLSAGHLDIILSYATASLRLDPRPIYLIFENAGRECASEHMSFFEKASLPLLNRAKAFLFAPVSIAVYRSKVEIANERAREKA